MSLSIQPAVLTTKTAASNSPYLQRTDVEQFVASLDFHVFEQQSAGQFLDKIIDKTRELPPGEELKFVKQVVNALSINREALQAMQNPPFNAEDYAESVHIVESGVIERFLPNLDQLVLNKKIDEVKNRATLAGG